MKICKEFRVESAHIVRNCTSERCSHSIHGHSAVIEVFLESKHLDGAQMVYDFGLMKGTIKQFVDSMDHCYLLCSKDSTGFQESIKKYSDRWISFPFNPSAEMLSLYLLKNIRDILDHTGFGNCEDPDVLCTGVRYHETTTGWAESNVDDLVHLWFPAMNDITYSAGVIKDWSPDLREFFGVGTPTGDAVSFKDPSFLCNYVTGTMVHLDEHGDFIFKNPEIKHQIEL